MRDVRPEPTPKDVLDKIAREKRLLKLNAFVDKHEKAFNVLFWVIGGLIGYFIYKFTKYLFLLIIEWIEDIGINKMPVKIYACKPTFKMILFL